MITSRFIALLFAMFVSFYMVTVMTFLITWLNTGLNEEFISHWWRAFYISWPVAFVLITFGAPRISKFIMWLTKNRTSPPE